MIHELRNIAADADTQKAFLRWAAERAREPFDEVYRFPERRLMHAAVLLNDDRTGEPLGKLWYTLGTEADGTLRFDGPDNLPSFHDIDLTLCGSGAVELDVLEETGPFSDWNRGVLAEIRSTNRRTHRRVAAEAVNRFVPGETLVGRTLSAAVTAFPRDVDTDGSLAEVFSLLFAPPLEDEDAPSFGGFPLDYTADNPFEPTPTTTLVGTVVSTRPARLRAGETVLEWTTVELDTALGRVPVPAGERLRELAELRPGGHVYMEAHLAVEWLM